MRGWGLGGREAASSESYIVYLDYFAQRRHMSGALVGLFICVRAARPGSGPYGRMISRRSARWRCLHSTVPAY